MTSASALGNAGTKVRGHNSARKEEKMTAFELFKQKYEETLLSLTKKQWEIIKKSAELEKMSIPDYMISKCIVVTINDANPHKNAEAYWELIQMNKDKLVASNRHRQYHGKVDAFWLTKKGFKEFNKQYNT